MKVVPASAVYAMLGAAQITLTHFVTWSNPGESWTSTSKSAAAIFGSEGATSGSVCRSVLHPASMVTSANAIKHCACTLSPVQCFHLAKPRASPQCRASSSSSSWIMIRGVTPPKMRPGAAERAYVQDSCRIWLTRISIRCFPWGSSRTTIFSPSLTGSITRTLVETRRIPAGCSGWGCQIQIGTKSDNRLIVTLLGSGGATAGALRLGVRETLAIVASKDSHIKAGSFFQRLAAVWLTGLGNLADIPHACLLILNDRYLWCRHRRLPAYVVRTDDPALNAIRWRRGVKCDFVRRCRLRSSKHRDPNGRVELLQHLGLHAEDRHAELLIDKMQIVPSARSRRKANPDR